MTVTLEMLASDKENKRMSQQHLFWDNLMATAPHSMYVNAEDCYLSSGVVSDGAFEMDKRERRRRTAVTTIYMPMERVF